MAGEYLGDFPTGQTIYVYFNTFDSNDPSASVTLTGLAVTDIEIYKNGSTTQRASDAGYALLDTDGIDFDGITGIHGFSIDTSDNTDAGFYAAGNDYTVIVSSVTVDAATINFIAARFSIDNRGLLRPSVAGRTLGVEADGDLTKVNTLDGHTAQTGDTYALANGATGFVAIDTAIAALSGDALALEDIAQANWEYSSRVLTAGTNIALAKGTGVTGFTDLDAAGVRTAVGLASANLDTQLADVPTVAEFEARTIVAANYFDPATDRVLLDKTDALRVTASVNDAGATSTVFITTLTEATDDHYKGRVVIFTSGAMLGQASDITAYNGTTKALTVTALTEAPANSVAFEIV